MKDEKYNYMLFYSTIGSIVCLLITLFLVIYIPPGPQGIVFLTIMYPLHMLVIIFLKNNNSSLKELYMTKSLFSFLIKVLSIIGAASLFPDIIDTVSTFLDLSQLTLQGYLLSMVAFFIASFELLSYLIKEREMKL